jgi:hypothetical protein
VTNLVLTLVVALGALYAADRAGWLPELGAAPVRSDTTRSVEIAEPLAQAREPAAVALPEPAPDAETAAPAPPFQEARLESDLVSEGAADAMLEPALDDELDVPASLPELDQQDRSAALVRRMLSLYRRGGERR